MKGALAYSSGLAPVVTSVVEAPWKVTSILLGPILGED